MMNTRSLFLLLFFIQHNVWAMDTEAYKTVVAQAAYEGATWATLRKISSTQTPQSTITLAPHIRIGIEDMSTREAKKYGVTQTSETDQINQAPQASETTQKPAAQTVPKKKSTPAVTKKGDKKKTKSEDLDSLLAEFAEKDAKQRPKSPLHSSTQNNNSTIPVQLHTEEHKLVIEFLDRVKYKKADCNCCKSKKCKTKRSKIKIGTVSYPATDKKLRFTRTTLGIAFHDDEKQWKFVARQTNNNWAITFNSCYGQRHSIIDQLNVPFLDISPSDSDDSSDDQTDEERESNHSKAPKKEDSEEKNSEEETDRISNGAQLILNRLRASQANRVTLDPKRNTSAAWVNPKTKDVVEYSKNGKILFYIDVESESIIAL